MRHWQQADERAVLKEFDYFTLVREATVHADLLHLRHEHLQESHNRLQG